MFIKKRQEHIMNSRLSINSNNDISAVYFNGDMVLVMLERKDLLDGDYVLFYRPNTYDYVIGKHCYFNGSFEVEWDSGTYGSFEMIADSWASL